MEVVSSASARTDSVHRSLEVDRSINITDFDILICTLLFKLVGERNLVPRPSGSDNGWTAHRFNGVQEQERSRSDRLQATSSPRLHSAASLIWLCRSGRRLIRQMAVFVADREHIQTPCRSPVQYQDLRDTIKGMLPTEAFLMDNGPLSPSLRKPIVRLRS